MLLINHWDGRKNQYAESIKFRQLTHGKDEPLSSFALRLRKAASHCNYGPFLDRMLTEQLLFGLMSRTICDEIIAKEPKDFSEAYNIAQRLEASHQSALEMRIAALPDLEGDTNKIGLMATRHKATSGQKVRAAPRRRGERSREGRTEKLSCYGCGGPHSRDRCKFRNATCYACNKTGYIAKVCKSKTAHVTEEDEQDDAEFIQRLNQIGTTNCGKHMLEVFINGKKINMELDTGAPCSIVSRKTLKKVIQNPRILKTTRNFSSYTGHRINCIGCVVTNVKVGLTTRKLNMYIVDDDFDSLFGREWIAQFVKEIDFVGLFAPSEQVGAMKVAIPRLPAYEAQAIQDIIKQH
ncbi:uncharacterized protein LOC142224844 [Haematobia irritans]|uniref:uncharacterized protein LOC142224844 n=1 Tax=Haematobia irritans TaxID=7368 RepID=UPI003F502DD1